MHTLTISGGSAIEQWWKSGCHVPLATVNVICRKIKCDVYPHISTVSTRCFYLQTAKIHVNLCLHNSWAKWPCNYESPTQIRIRANSLNYLTHLELAEVQKYHPDIYHLVKLNKCPWQLNVFNGADQKPQDAAEARRPSRVHSSFHGARSRVSRPKTNSIQQTSIVVQSVCSWVFQYQGASFSPTPRAFYQSWADCIML